MEQQQPAAEPLGKFLTLLTSARDKHQAVNEDYKRVVAKLQNAPHEEHDYLQQKAARMLETLECCADTLAIGDLYVKGPFKTEREWSWLLTQGVLECKVLDLPDDAPRKLVQHGIHNPAAMLQMSTSELCHFLECNESVAHWVIQRCSRYIGTVTKLQLLKTDVRPPRVTLDLASAAQTNIHIQMQLQYRKFDIWADMLAFRDTLDNTQALFPRWPDENFPTGLSGEYAVDVAHEEAVASAINRMLQVDAHLEGVHPYQLCYHRVGCISGSAVKAISTLSPTEQAHAASCHAHELVSGMRHIPHWVLRRTEGHDMRTVAVGQDISIEQLIIIPKDGEAAPPYAMGLPAVVEVEAEEGCQMIKADAPDVLRLLQQAGSSAEAKDQAQEDMRMNVEAAVKQLARYCRDAKTSWGYFGNYYYTWGMRLEENTVYVSDPVRCTDPSALLLIYYICSMGIAEANQREAASSGNHNGKDAVSNAGSSSQGDPVGSAGAAAGDDGNSAATDTCPAGRSFLWLPNKAARTQEQHRKSEAADLAESSGQHLQLQPQQPVKVSDQASAAAAAAQVDLDLVQGFLALSWTGCVFCYTMSDGRSAALKLAEFGSEQAATLRAEARALLALQPEWGESVAGLRAAGKGKDGCSYVLAVERMPNCSHISISDQRKYTCPPLLTDPTWVPNFD